MNYFAVVMAIKIEFIPSKCNNAFLKWFGLVSQSSYLTLNYG